MNSLTKLHFHRFEFKYILGEELRREVEGELRFFMDFDPFVARNPRFRYFVRSLYYDDAFFSHYYDKIDGQLHRSKFRLRTYNDDPAKACAAFLEIKGRHNNMVFKHRTPIDEGIECFFQAGERDVTRRILERAAGGEILDRFRFDVLRKGIQPVMLIDYYRRPYVSKYDPEFRVTFDEKLRATKTDTLHPGKGARERSVMRGYTIMEVKFRFHVPSWFHRIIQSCELDRVSVSKICKGIEVFHLTPKL